MKWVTLDDGRLELTLSQSSLGTYFMCPESARLEAVGLMPKNTTDAAVTGNAFHSGAEFVLLGGAVADGAQAVLDAYEKIEQFGDPYGLAEGEVDPNWVGINYVQAKTKRTALGLALRCFEAWVEHVLPGLPGPLDERAVERKFRRVKLYEDDSVVILLSGTMDYVDETFCIWDWKTAGREYEAYEYRRYKIQPTVYTYALAREHDLEGDVEFSYGIAIKSGSTRKQLIHTTRNRTDWDWLVKQARGVAALALAMPEGPWPLIDQGWHCSPKWCAAFAAGQCKGAIKGTDPW